MTTDFAQLYLQLGIRDDCSLEEFKQACRRRIRQQHPDRLEEHGNWNAAQLPLTELLALYAKALRFHRRHGRLPGAAATATTLNAVIRPLVPVLPKTYHAKIPPVQEPKRNTLRIPALILATTVIGYAAVNLWNENEATAEASTSAIGSNAPEIMEPEQTKIVREPAAQEAITVQQDGQPVVAPPRLIEIGMDAETVRSIQGDPVQWEGSEWIYGPSWIRFERGRVIDWYSSPLRRLKTETSSP